MFVVVCFQSEYSVCLACYAARFGGGTVVRSSEQKLDDSFSKYAAL